VPEMGRPRRASSRRVGSSAASVLEESRVVEGGQAVRRTGPSSWPRGQAWPRVGIPDRGDRCDTAVRLRGLAGRAGFIEVARRITSAAEYASVRTEAPLLIVFGFLLFGCGTPDPPEPAVAVRDSAGTRIVESLRPRLPPGSWAVEDEPVLQIGGATATGLAALYRVSDAGTLPDGGLVVANVGSQELRFFGPDGEPLGTAGSHGSGPGEFRDLNHVDVLPDGAVFVFDGLLARVTVFERDGEVRSVESYPVPGAGYAFFRGRLPDGRVLAFRGWISSSAATPRRTGRYRTRDALVLAGSDRLDTLGVLPGSDNFILIQEDGDPLYTSPPLPRGRRDVVVGDRIFTAGTERYEIRQLDATGETVAIIRRQMEPVPAGPEHVDAFRSARLDASDTPSNRRTVEAILDAAELPEHVPVLSGLLGDQKGNLWVQPSDFLGFSPSQWSVFDSTGAWVTDVTLPVSGRVFEIGDGYVLGVWRDDLDAEQVRVYRLSKGG
jgi:hypothetical protein